MPTRSGGMIRSTLPAGFGLAGQSTNEAGDELLL
jgi:hypothetical protein